MLCIYLLIKRLLILNKSPIFEISYGSIPIKIGILIQAWTIQSCGMLKSAVGNGVTNIFDLAWLLNEIAQCHRPWNSQVLSHSAAGPSISFTSPKMATILILLGGGCSPACLTLAQKLPSQCWQICSVLTPPDWPGHAAAFWSPLALISHRICRDHLKL